MGVSLPFSAARYSGKIYMQYAVPTAIRKMGTIIVSMERGVPVQAIRPKVHTRAMTTEPAGINIPLRFPKKM